MLKLNRMAKTKYLSPSVLSNTAFTSRPIDELKVAVSNDGIHCKSCSSGPCPCVLIEDASIWSLVFGLSQIRMSLPGQMTCAAVTSDSATCLTRQSQIIHLPDKPHGPRN